MSLAVLYELLESLSVPVPLHLMLRDVYDDNILDFIVGDGNISISSSACVVNGMLSTLRS